MVRTLPPAKADGANESHIMRCVSGDPRTHADACYERHGSIRSLQRDCSDTRAIINSARCEAMANAGDWLLSAPVERRRVGPDEAEEIVGVLRLVIGKIINAFNKESR